MPDTHSQCPKCGHNFPHPLPSSASCPACGIYLFKWDSPALPHHDAQAGDEPGFAASLLQPLEHIDAAAFYGRCAILAALTFWSWRLFGYDYRDGEIGASFMHNILLPIHEAGHVLFLPFGEFMTILGGSLFQLLFPFGIGIAFIWKNRDNFGAAIGLWWASVSLLDLAPYIYDALHPQLILLGGHTGEDGPHDWIYLLSTLGQLQNSQRWGAATHVAGGILLLAALAWAAAVLWRQHRQSTKDEET